MNKKLVVFLAALVCGIGACGMLGAVSNGGNWESADAGSASFTAALTSVSVAGVTFSYDNFENLIDTQLKKKGYPQSLIDQANGYIEEMKSGGIGTSAMIALSIIFLAFMMISMVLLYPVGYTSKWFVVSVAVNALLGIVCSVCVFVIWQVKAHDGFSSLAAGSSTKFEWCFIVSVIAFIFALIAGVLSFVFLFLHRFASQQEGLPTFDSTYQPFRDQRAASQTFNE